jgi:hypothetical protein
MAPNQALADRFEDPAFFVAEFAEPQLPREYVFECRQTRSSIWCLSRSSSAS